MQQFRAIIFDMDGVLFLSSPAHELAFREALTEEGIEPKFRYSDVAGMRTESAIRRILSDQGISFGEEDVLRMARRKRELAHGILRQSRPVARGCRELLERLAKTHRLALASSSSAENINLFLQESGCASLFSIVKQGSDVREAKPHPAIYSDTLADLEVEPGDALVVEDSVSGTAAGVAAGCQVYAVLGTASVDEIQRAGASRILRNLSELEEGL